MSDDFFEGRTLARRKALGRVGAPVTEDDARPEPAPDARAEPKATPKAAPKQAPAPSRGSSPVRPHMVDIGAKPVVHREATAEGFLKLAGPTLDALRLGTAPKGDPFPPAMVAGIMAAKNTPQLIPLCHPLSLTGVEVDLQREAGGVRCRATVRTDGKTGVEMEALAAVTAALLTVWDMTKALEKDERGQYPDTRLEAIRVVNKSKGAPGR